MTFRAWWNQQLLGHHTFLPNKSTSRTRIVSIGALVKSLEATIAMRIAMPPHRAKAPASEGAPPSHLTPLDPTSRPSPPPQSST